MRFFRNQFFSLYLLLLVFVIVSTLTRIMLLVKAFRSVHPGPLLLGKIFGVGLVYDLTTFTYFAMPFALAVVLLPHRFCRSRIGKFIFCALFFLTIYALLFDMAAEYFFFDEFGTRFNFIAVDYLIYTTEVLRNIRESYPIAPILAGLLTACFLIFRLVKPRLVTALETAASMRYRLAAAAVFILLPLVSYRWVDLSFTEISTNSFANELAGNGLYDLAAAFRNNEL
ncbi:MAG TPA: sulfatase, partial [Verrucomicrobiae bacterium]|nr:sulfatase [Verrucomicrobiae bacterium]